MAYKTMKRKVPSGIVKGPDKHKAFLDECLKEGTDQGWTLHSMYRENADAPLAPRWHIFVWETND